MSEASAEACAVAEAAWIEQTGAGDEDAQWWTHRAWEAAWQAALDWAASHG